MDYPPATPFLRTLHTVQASGRRSSAKTFLLTHRDTLLSETQTDPNIATATDTTDTTTDPHDSESGLSLDFLHFRSLCLAYLDCEEYDLAFSSAMSAFRLTLNSSESEILSSATGGVGVGVGGLGIGLGIGGTGARSGGVGSVPGAVTGTSEVVKGGTGVIVSVGVGVRHETETETASESESESESESHPSHLIRDENEDRDENENDVEAGGDAVHPSSSSSSSEIVDSDSLSLSPPMAMAGPIPNSVLLTSDPDHETETETETKTETETETIPFPVTEDSDPDPDSTSAPSSASASASASGGGRFFRALRNLVLRKRRPKKPKQPKQPKVKSKPKPKPKPKPKRVRVRRVRKRSGRERDADLLRWLEAKYLVGLALAGMGKRRYPEDGGGGAGAGVSVSDTIGVGLGGDDDDDTLYTKAILCFSEALARVGVRDEKLSVLPEYDDLNMTIGVAAQGLRDDLHDDETTGGIGINLNLNLIESDSEDEFDVVNVSSLSSSSASHSSSAVRAVDGDDDGDPDDDEEEGEGVVVDEMRPVQAPSPDAELLSPLPTSTEWTDSTTIKINLSSAFRTRAGKRAASQLVWRILVERGYIYHRLCLFRRAIRDWWGAVKIERKAAIAYCFLGHFYERFEFRVKIAHDCFMKAVRFDPKSGLYLACAARMTLYMRQVDRAFAMIENAKELDPTSSDVLIKHVQMLHWLDRHEEGLEIARRSVEELNQWRLYGEHWGHAVVAEMLAKTRKDIVGARKELALAMVDFHAIDSMARQRILLSQSMVYQSMYEEGRNVDYVNFAERCCRKAIRLGEMNVNPFLQLSYILYVYHGLHFASIEVCERALELVPRNTKTLGNLGWISYTLNRVSAAEKFFLQAIELCEWYESAHYGLAHIYLDWGRLDDAKRCARKAISLALNNEENYSYHFKLGEIYLAEREDDLSAAEMRVAEAIAKEGNHPEMYYNNQANALYRECQYEAAIDAYGKALAFKERALFYCNRGNAQMSFGKPDLALEDAKRALAVDSRYDAAYVVIGGVHVVKQNYLEAIEAFRQAVELRPTMEDAKLSIAYCYLKLSELGEGLDELLRSSVTCQGDHFVVHGDNVVMKSSLIKDYRQLVLQEIHESRNLSGSETEGLLRDWHDEDDFVDSDGARARRHLVELRCEEGSIYVRSVFVLRCACVSGDMLRKAEKAQAEAQIVAVSVDGVTIRSLQHAKMWLYGLHPDFTSVDDLLDFLVVAEKLGLLLDMENYLVAHVVGPLKNNGEPEPEAADGDPKAKPTSRTSGDTQAPQAGQEGGAEGGDSEGPEEPTPPTDPMRPVLGPDDDHYICRQIGDVFDLACSLNCQDRPLFWQCIRYLRENEHSLQIVPTNPVCRKVLSIVRFKEEMPPEYRFHPDPELDFDSVLSVEEEGETQDERVKLTPSYSPTWHLSRQFASLRNHDLTANVVLVAEDGIARFRVHREVLALRSDYFRALLYGRFAEGGAERGTIQIEASWRHLSLLIQFVYYFAGTKSGFDPSKLSPEDLNDLMTLANKYLLFEMEMLCKVALLQTTMNEEQKSQS